jgi:hypothetical protein
VFSISVFGIVVDVVVFVDEDIFLIEEKQTKGRVGRGVGGRGNILRHTSLFFPMSLLC